MSDLSQAIIGRPVKFAVRRLCSKRTACFAPRFMAVPLLGMFMLLIGSAFRGQARAAGDRCCGQDSVWQPVFRLATRRWSGKTAFGPSLAAVIGRKAGGLAGFNYSPGDGAVGTDLG